MRLEINIGDERPEAKILKSISDPTAFVLELVRHSEQAKVAGWTPDYLSILDQAQQSPNRFKTPAEVDAYLTELRSEW